MLNGEVRGEGRYDDAPDNMPAPDMLLVNEMARVLACTKDAPAAFRLDVGVLDTGETALIEVNDAWGLGYYKGTLAHKDYIQMLWMRWEQLTNELRVMQMPKLEHLDYQISAPSQTSPMDHGGASIDSCAALVADKPGDWDIRRAAEWGGGLVATIRAGKLQAL